MEEIVNIISEISKSLLRLCFGMFLVWMGFSIHNLSKKTKQSEPIYIENKTYNDNEKEVTAYMDSVMQLPINEQRKLVEELARKYSGQY